jgi:hypothetical protein
MQINLHIQLNLHMHAEKLIHFIQLHREGGGCFDAYSLSLMQNSVNMCGTVFGTSTKQRFLIGSRAWGMFFIVFSTLISIYLIV